MLNKTKLRYHSTMNRIYIFLKWELVSLGKVVEKLEYKYIAGGHISGWNHCWKTGWWYLKKLNRITIWPSNSISSYLPQIIQNMLSHKYLYVNVQSCLICNSQKKKPKIYQWMNGWTKCDVSIYTMEYYSTLKMKYWYKTQCW